MQAALTALGKRFDPYGSMHPGAMMFPQHDQESEVLGAYTQAALLAQQGSLQANFDYTVPASLFTLPPHPMHELLSGEVGNVHRVPDPVARPPARPPLEECTELEFVQDLVRSSPPRVPRRPLAPFHGEGD